MRIAREHKHDKQSSRARGNSLKFGAIAPKKLLGFGGTPFLREVCKFERFLFELWASQSAALSAACGSLMSERVVFSSLSTSLIEERVI
jgi:hypothetical protein